MKTTLHVTAADADSGTKFEGDVVWYSKAQGAWKSVLVIPQQPDQAIYGAVIERAITLSSCRIDPNALIAIEERPDNSWRFLDYDIPPPGTPGNRFVVNVQVVEQHIL